jgi:hypothetical protein
LTALIRLQAVKEKPREYKISLGRFKDTDQFVPDVNFEYNILK